MKHFVSPHHVYIALHVSSHYVFIVCSGFQQNIAFSFVSLYWQHHDVEKKGTALHPGAFIKALWPSSKHSLRGLVYLENETMSINLAFVVRIKQDPVCTHVRHVSSCSGKGWGLTTVIIVTGCTSAHVWCSHRLRSLVQPLPVLMPLSPVQYYLGDD